VSSTGDTTIIFPSTINCLTVLSNVVFQLRNESYYEKFHTLSGSLLERCRWLPSFIFIFMLVLIGQKTGWAQSQPVRSETYAHF
jgi:hypothetical protein